MVSQDLSLAQLYSVDSVFPIDLPSVAALEPPATEMTTTAVRSVLEMFADIMRANGLSPVLCELAVISDISEWRPTSSSKARHFVSLINTYGDYMNAGAAKELAASWVSAIASLPRRMTRVPRPDGPHPERSFIVLNPHVYDTLSFRRSMNLIGIRPKGEPSAPNPMTLPAVKKFGFEKSNDLENFSADAERSIMTLMRNTFRGVSQEARDDLGKCYLVIVPFSRPYLNIDDFSPGSEKSAYPNEASRSLLTSYPAISKDPGGCFFGIYHAPSLKKTEVHPNERLFYLQIQYLLTLSAFVEARRNLISYYDDQLKKDWGFLLHSVKHDIMTPRTVIDSRLIIEPNAQDLILASDRLEVLNTLAGISSDVMKARTTPDGESKLVMHSTTLEIMWELNKTLTRGSNLTEKDWAYNYKNIPRLRLDIQQAAIENLEQTKLLDGAASPIPTTEFAWIGKLHKVICHEINNNARRHAARTDINGVDVCNVRWALFVRAGKLWVVFENVVFDDDGEREGARLLAEKGELFKRSTGLGQMRLGLSGPLDLGDLDVDLVIAPQYVFQISIPIGKKL